MSRKLLNFEWIIGIMGTLSFITLILIVALVEIDYFAKVVLVLLSLILFSVAIVSAMKIEREVGYYECNCCHHKYIPKSLPFWLSMHIVRTRYLRCAKCHKYSWNKKVLTK